MPKPELEVAISPCPNDVFIFSGILLKKIDACLEFTINFYDIEELNQLAIEGRYHLIKASFASLKRLIKDYQVLRIGSALGFNAGPLLIAKKLPYPRRPIVGIPGEHTTAHLLFDLFFKGQAQKSFLPFHQIIPQLLAGNLDLGVLIHEGRFVHQELGLKLVCDFGCLWEDKHKLPLPLGGLFVRRDLSPEVKGEILSTIRKSLVYAKQHWLEVLPLLKAQAQELKEEVIRRHVETFVNEYTYDLGEVGSLAIKTLARYQNLPECEFSNLFWG